MKKLIKDPLVIKALIVTSIAIFEFIYFLPAQSVQMKDTLFVRYENLGSSVNSAYPDFSAVLNQSEDLMVFTSRRKGNTGGMIPQNDIYEYEDIFYSKKQNNGTWSQAKKLKGKVNTADHEAPVWLSDDGRRLFLYRHTTTGDIYESHFDGKSWSKPKSIKAINSNSRETHASMTADGQSIYFTSTSTKYGNQGELDIFVVHLDPVTKRWSKPQNLGEHINTPFNEECVTVSGDGKTLYFSSEGHNSIGGFDLFISYYENGSWTAPVNMGYPINTTSNDRYIFLTSDGKHAYLDSDRPGGLGSSDVYKVTFLNNIDLPAVFRINANEEMIAETSVKIRDLGNGNKIAVQRMETGEFAATLKGYRYYEMEIEVAEQPKQVIGFNTKMALTDSTFVKEINLENDHHADAIAGMIDVPEAVLEKPVSGKFPELPMDADLSGALSVIYFDFNSSELNAVAERQLETLRDLLISFPQYKVQLEGHTDGKSSNEYNHALSLKRVVAVKLWLIKHGISLDRIVSDWHGEDKPIANETHEDGSDHASNRQLNRRVEATLIK